MPPSRFAAVSRWRNLELKPGKSGSSRHEEVGLASAPDPNACSTILAICSDVRGSRVLFRSSNSTTHLSVIHDAFEQQAFGKHGRKLPSFAAAPSGAHALADFAVETWHDDPLLAAGGSDGSIAIRSLSGAETQHLDAPVRAALPSLAGGGTSSGPAASLNWHPTTRGLLLAATGDALRLWDVQGSSTQPSTQLEVDQVGVSRAVWSWDGRLVAATGKDATVKLYDPRASSSLPVSSAQAHASKIKPTRLTFVSPDSNALLTTGFDAMRAREWALWDLRASQSAVARSSLDVNTAPLEPICEPDRGLVFLTSRTSTNVHWLDIGTQSCKAPSASASVPLGLPAGGPAVFAPTRELDVMQGEIARLVFPGLPGTGASNDCIVPASITVPRRQYIDFHADLFPPALDRRASALSQASLWLGGEDTQLARRSLDPDRGDWNDRAPKAEDAPLTNATAAVRTESSTPHEIAAVKTSDGRHAAPVLGSTADASELQGNLEGSARPAETPKSSALSNPPAATGTTPTMTSESPNAYQQGPAPRSTSSESKVPSHSERTAAAPVLKSSSSASGPRWSRRFIAGQTPLVAAYQNLATLDISRAPDARMLALSTELFVFPVSGPGGRLGVQSLSQTGRLPSPTPALSSGSALLDFVIDPFNPRRVITAAEDGLIRAWDVPDDKENDLPELSSTATRQCSLPGGGRSGELAPHPHAQGLLAVGPWDAEGMLHLLDLDTADDARILSLQLPGGGATSLSWSPDGQHLAVAGKDKTLRIVDTRKSLGPAAALLASSDAHSSPRSFRVIWLSDEVLLTVGHGAGSARELIVFHLASDSSTGSFTLKQVARQALDISPAVLFPHWDSDTEVLWLWSKGERSISSFEIKLHAVLNASSGRGGANDIFTSLPAFQHSQPQLGLAFLPKQAVDVRAVEIASAVRLSRTELQRVSWRVPRARGEFFQDDVFVPARDGSAPLLSAREWLDGKDGLPDSALIDLQPRDMTPREYTTASELTLTYSARIESDLPLALLAVSQAPAPVQTSHLPKGPIQRQETESERNDKILSSVSAAMSAFDFAKRHSPHAGLVVRACQVFAKAKLDEADRADPSARNAAAKRAPDDDDWDSD